MFGSAVLSGVKLSPSADFALAVRGDFFVQVFDGVALRGDDLSAAPEAVLDGERFGLLILQRVNPRLGRRIPFGVQIGARIPFEVRRFELAGEDRGGNRALIDRLAKLRDDDVILKLFDALAEADERRTHGTDSSHCACRP